MDQTATKYIIEIDNLSRRFGDKKALDAVTLNLEQGKAYGLIGENGAGKTTLLKHLVGLYKAQNGTVRVLGLDPVLDPVGALSKIGYLSEENTLPEWMKVGDLLRYTSSFYPEWDNDYATKLCQNWEVNLKAKTSTLSKGQKTRVAVICAMAYHPPILLFDEPSSGLDPLVRHELLNDIIGRAKNSGAVVLFSSHVLGEVEKVCDHVAMIRKGKLVVNEPIDSLLERYERIVFEFDSPRNQPLSIPGIEFWEGGGKKWTAIANVSQSSATDFAAEAEKEQGKFIRRSPATLEDIFLIFTPEGERRNLEN
jgi:ABC-2 type transport system ATP-binding protein